MPVHVVSGEVMEETWLETVTPQGLLAVCGFVDVPLDVCLPRAPPGGPLASVRDPGNAGNAPRTADRGV